LEIIFLKEIFNITQISGLHSHYIQNS